MKEKVLQIMELCYDISNTTKHDVFFSYSPHVSQVSINIHHNGWINDEGMMEEYVEKKPDIKFAEWKKLNYNYEHISAYLKNENKIDKIIIYLKEMLLNESN